MNIINIYNTDLRDLENLLMSQVQVGDADELHNGLIVAVKKMRQLEARNDEQDSLRELIFQLGYLLHRRESEMLHRSQDERIQDILSH